MEISKRPDNDIINQFSEAQRELYQVLCKKENRQKRLEAIAIRFAVFISVFFLFFYAKKMGSFESDEKELSYLSNQLYFMIFATFFILKLYDVTNPDSSKRMKTTIQKKYGFSYLNDSSIISYHGFLFLPSKYWDIKDIQNSEDKDLYLKTKHGLLRLPLKSYYTIDHEWDQFLVLSEDQIGKSDRNRFILRLLKGEI